MNHSLLEIQLFKTYIHLCFCHNIELMEHHTEETGIAECLVWKQLKSRFINEALPESAQYIRQPESEGDEDRLCLNPVWCDYKHQSNVSAYYKSLLDAAKISYKENGYGGYLIKHNQVGA